MGDSLSSLFRDNYRLQFSVDEWSEEVNQLFQKNQIEKSKVQSFLHQISYEAQSTKERILHLEKFQSILLLTSPFCMSYEEYLLPSANKLLREQIFDDHALIQAQKEMIRHLLSLKGEGLSLPASLILEKKPYMDRYQSPSPMWNAKCAILWALLGHLQDKEEYKNKAVDFAVSLASFLDYDGLPFSALWTLENDYNQLEVFSSYFLLFYIAYNLLHEQVLKSLLSPLLSRIENIVQQTLGSAPIYLTLLNLWVEKIKQPAIHHFNTKSILTNSLFLPDLAVIGKKNESMSSVISFEGVGTGLGSLHANGMKIKTFGPQFFPLDGSKGFGLYRLPQDSKDLKISNSELSGWVRMCKHESLLLIQPQNVWMFIQSKLKEESLVLESLLYGNKENERIAFVFYLNAQSCKIADKTIVPKSLSRYIGPPSEISIQGEKCVRMAAVNAKEVQVIPLAGENCYWDSDFLIAFEMNDKPLSVSVCV